MCQSPPQGETLHPCPQEFREKVLLTCNAITLKNGVSAGGTQSSERKKDNGEGSRGERGTLWPREENAMLLFSQTERKNTTNTTTMKFCTRDVENSDSGTLHAGASL